jgi:hypothetical protein
MRLGVLALLAAASPALAQELPLPGGRQLEVHGFASAGFILTTENNYLADSEGGSFELAEAGINLTTQLTDRLRFGLQLFARDLGPIGDYDAKIDWFYLDYDWTNEIGLRAGRIKLPFGLYNEASDADPARVPILLPQSLYPIQNRDFLLAHTGVELYGLLGLGGAGALDWRLYTGTIFIENERNPSSPFDILELNIPWVAGGRLLWETPLAGLRVGGSVQVLRLESELLVPGDPDAVGVDVPAVLWVASAELTRGELVLAAEYSRWHTEIESSDPMAFPESQAVSERAYAMASYRLNPRLTAGVYHSVLFPDVDHRAEDRTRHQHDAAATLRIDLNDHWLFKLEAHYMHGTAALTVRLNDLPPAMLARNWAVFLAKTTAYF